MKPKGFSLLEIIISLTLAAGVSFFGFKVYERLVKSNQRRDLEDQVDTALALSARFIQRTGRTAQSCSKVMDSGVPTLECQVETSRPPSGNLKRVRFTTDVAGLRYEEWDAGTSTWIKRNAFSDVQFLTFCDGTEMAGGSCEIPPLAIHSIAGFSGRQGRLFRIYLRTKLAPKSGVEIDRGLTTAFYVRNPSPFGDDVVFH